MLSCVRSFVVLPLCLAFTPMSRFKFAPLLVLAICAVLRLSALPPSLMEKLGRGMVAVRPTTDTVFVGWRLLGNDAADTAFNLYRVTGSAAPLKLNLSPIAGPTHFIDSSADFSQDNRYFVRAIVNGAEQSPSGAFTLPANAPIRQYLSVPLQVPTGGTTPDNFNYVYSANDCSVADLDGDGEYEIVVKWDPNNSKDNSQAGYTGNVLLDAYKLNGTLLWRIDLGKNIRAGAHYTQFMVYDLDGDGIAEVACRTAPGSKDATGAFVATTPARFTGLKPSFDPNADFRSTAGYILTGYEFLTIFNGQTGEELASTFYVPPRNNNINSPDVSAWGDNYGNRVDRFLAGVAYLDGQRPSLVMCRGYYTRAVLAAWDWRNGQLTSRWVFDSDDGTPGNSDYRGQGAHSLTIGDVDGDGKDEIIYGAAAIDDNGKGLYSTRLGHGDALHLSDLSPDRPGQEVWMVHEEPRSYGPNGLEFRDARTGALIFGVDGQNSDVGRGVTMDIDPRYKGAEMWGARGGLYAVDGTQISPTHPPQMNFAVWWDGDLLREILDGITISKWDWNNASTTPLLAATGAASINGTKATPNLSGDLFGDWREEVVWRSPDSTELRIYTTVIPTTVRQYTLMHDRQYREAIAWQNVGYNQPPHPSFYLGVGMASAPPPNIVTSLSELLGPPAPVFTGVSTDTGLSDSDQVTQDRTLVIHGFATAGASVVVTRIGTGVVGSTTADSTGNWSIDYQETSLPEGSTLFTATATDPAGNMGPPSLPWTVTIDTVAPAGPNITDVTEMPSLIVSGHGEVGTEVSVLLDGVTSLGAATVDSSGQWSLASSRLVLSKGAHAFTASAKDLAGNGSSASAAFNVSTALATPTITGVSPDTGISNSDRITSDPTLSILGTADPSTVVRVSRRGAGVIGVTTSDQNGAWTLDYTATPLPDGEQVFTAVAENGSSATPSSAAFTVKVDTSPPAVISINRQSPVSPATSATELVFRVTFNEPVLGVDAADFSVVTGGTARGTIGAITAVNGSTFDLSISGITGIGAVRVDLKAGGTEITDSAGNAEVLGFTQGQSYDRTLTGNGVWITPTTGGQWSENANWQGGVIGSGVGSVADFSSLDLTADNRVSLDAPRTVGGLIFGDAAPATAASWTVDDAGDYTNALTLAVAAGSPGLTVNPLGANAVVTLDLPLAGTAGFTKAGTGTLILKQNNTITGPLNLSGGTIRLDTGSSLSTGAGAITLNTSATATLLVTGGELSAGGLTTVGAAGNAGTFILESGSAAFNGGIRTNADFGSVIRVNGGTFNASNVEIRRNSGAAADFASGFLVAGGTSTVGTIGLGTGNSTGALALSGGTLTVTGPLTVGFQATAARGGALRVTGGNLNVTDLSNGLVLARNPGANPNNVASATFTGGVSAIEKITLGYDANVTAGSATVLINGGALYLGEGGIVKNGTGTFATTLTLTSGTLGANADWSTGVNFTLPTANSIQLKAAGTNDAPHAITLSGTLTGAGGLNKTGAGVVTLGGINTYAGATTINTGELQLNGSLAAASSVIVNSTGILSGTGAAAGAVTLNAGGTISPGGTAQGTLSLGSLTWKSGGRLLIDLSDNSDRLVLSGALTKGSTGACEVVFRAPTTPSSGTAFTLVTFGSTNFTAEDFTVGGAGLSGYFVVNAGSLQFVAGSAAPGAAYQAWASNYSFPSGQSGTNDDPDGDGLSNLLEFVVAENPLQPGAALIQVTKVTIDGNDYPALSFVRRHDVGGVRLQVLVSKGADFATELGSVEVSVIPRQDGNDDVIIRSLVPLSEETQQFLRLQATLP